MDDDILALLADVEAAEDHAQEPEQSQSSSGVVVGSESEARPSGDHRQVPTRSHLGQPIGWREELPRELDAEMREMGCHSSGKSVEALRAVQTMFNTTPEGQRAASCFIRSVARRAGLDVTVKDDPIDWSQHERKPNTHGPAR